MFFSIWVGTLTFVNGADASLQCNECHGSHVPSDYRPIDAPYRNVTTGGFIGNHRTHMAATTSAAACEKCHPGSSSYNASHRDGTITLSHRINNSPLAAFYKNRVYSFPQTPTPSPGSCSFVNCHFEKTTPDNWGRTPLSTEGDCSYCHSFPASSGAHAKHDSYLSWSGNSCSWCHPDHKSGLKFSHATSAGNRGVKVALYEGNYSGTGMNYLPSQSQSRVFGSCTDLYCHSPGNRNAAPFNAPGQVPSWNTMGGLGCSGCHGANTGSGSTINSGSHSAHVYQDGGYFSFFSTGCSTCHAVTVKEDMSFHNPYRHANRQVDVAFDSRTTAENGTYNNQIARKGSPSSKTPGSAYATCNGVYCHSSGQGEGGTWPPAYRTPTWGSSATGACGSCHGSHGTIHGAVGTTNIFITTGSHTTHIVNYTFGLSDKEAKCAVCHAYATAGMTQTGCNSTLCHYSITQKHVNRQVDIGFADLFGASATYTGTPQPGDGYGRCSNTYCHSDGKSLVNNAMYVPANYPPQYSIGFTSPRWGDMNSDPQNDGNRCNNCHDSTPRYDLHNLHVTSRGYTCVHCHSSTVDANGGISDRSKHVNKQIDVVAGGDICVYNGSQLDSNFRVLVTNGQSILVRTDGSYNCYSHSIVYAPRVAPASGGTCSTTVCHMGLGVGSNTKTWTNLDLPYRMQVNPLMQPVVSQSGSCSTNGENLTISVTTDSCTYCVAPFYCDFTWGDGTATTNVAGCSASHLYPKATDGLYDITWSIRDSEGTTMAPPVQRVKTVSICSTPNVPPVADFGLADGISGSNYDVRLYDVAYDTDVASHPIRPGKIRVSWGGYAPGGSAPAISEYDVSLTATAPSVLPAPPPADRQHYFRYATGGYADLFTAVRDSSNQWSCSPTRRYFVSPVSPPSLDSTFGTPAVNCNSLIAAIPNYPQTIVSYLFNTAGNAEGWALVKQLSAITVTNGVLSTASTGASPTLNNTLFQVNGSDVPTLYVRMKSSCGSEGRFFWKTSVDEVENLVRSQPFGLTSNGTFQTYQVQMSGNPNWSGKEIVSLSLMPVNTSGCSIEIDSIASQMIP
jgi:predicted CxxxxCH...CXXCH cytochrome family protein